MKFRIGIIFLGLCCLCSSVFANTKEAQIAALKRQVPKLDRKMNVTFSKTDIRQVIFFFSSEFDMNIIANTEVVGDISFGFKNINIVDAFDAILLSQGFDWYVAQGVIYVVPQQPVEVIKLHYANAAEMATPVAQMLSGKGSVMVDSFSNSLILKAAQADVQRIKSVVAELDQQPLQVLVEVAIMDVQGDTAFNLGVGPNTTFPSGTTIKQNGIAGAVADGDVGLFANVIEGNFNVLIEALKSSQNINLLATPKILTLNHKQAQIITGQRLGYRVNTTSTDGQFVAQGVDFLDVGTKLTFTPHISENGDIIMEIKPEISEGNVSDGIPNSDRTEASTTVVVRDGQTVLLGGLIREKTVDGITGVPILSDIPFIGDFFKRKSTTTVKKETVVLITPRLVTPEALKKMTDAVISH